MSVRIILVRQIWYKFYAANNSAFIWENFASWWHLSSLKILHECPDINWSLHCFLCSNWAPVLTLSSSRFGSSPLKSHIYELYVVWQSYLPYILEFFLLKLWDKKEITPGVGRGMVAYFVNPSMLEAETGSTVNSWSAYGVPSQPGLHSMSLFWNKNSFSLCQHCLYWALCSTQVYWLVDQWIALYWLFYTHNHSFRNKDHSGRSVESKLHLS